MTTSTTSTTTSTSTSTSTSTTPPCLGDITLYVNGFGVEKDEWAKVGDSPYLTWGADNYVWEADDTDETGDYTFDDTAQDGHPKNISIQLYCKRGAGADTVTVWIHDGIGWNNAGTITPDVGYAWKTLDVSAILNTFAKINAAKMYLHYNA